MTLEISVVNGILVLLRKSNITVMRNGTKTVILHGAPKFVDKAIKELHYIG